MLLIVSAAALWLLNVSFTRWRSFGLFALAPLLLLSG